MAITGIPDLELIKEAVAVGNNLEVIELLQPVLHAYTAHDILPAICDAAETAERCGDEEYAETTLRLAVHLYQNCFVADHACGLRAIRSLEKLLRRQKRFIDLDVLNRNTRSNVARANRQLAAHGQAVERTDGPIDFYLYRRGA